VKVDPELIKVVAGLPDKELWITVRSLAGMKKIKLAEATPSPEKMAALRAALAGADKMDLASAMRVLNEYREKRG